MKRAKNRKSTIAEVEVNIDQMFGLNTFGPHADLRKGEFRALDNFDNYGDYIKSRRGSQKFISDLCPDLNILSHAVFDAGTDEYAIIQQANGADSEFRFLKLVAGSSWTDVVFKTSQLSYIITGSIAKADMMVSNGKVYIFHTSENSILEFNTTTSLFERRKMGMPAPQIKSITEISGGVLKGKRVYATELVYKDTTVTPNVPLIVSGPNRALAVTNPLMSQGALAYTEDKELFNFQVKVDPILNDGTNIDPAISAENDNWTHIRLYRSKDITTATNAAEDLEGESEITGRPDEMYQVQEIDRTTFLATLSGGVYSFNVDNILDDNMPFPLGIITDSRLELVPVPPASTGVFENNRVWASGILKLPGPGGLITSPNIESKIFFSPETDTIYSENMSPLHAIESEPGDGQKMIKLFPFRDDLIGIKEGKTGRVRNADPNLGWTTEDPNIGISNKEFAQFVPDIGICAIVNDQNDFRIFGFDLQWRSTFAGMQISRPIRDEIKGFTAADIDFLYVNGKLIINGGKQTMLVLATEQQSGWSRYVYALNSKSEAVFTFAEGTRALVINGGQPAIEIEAEDVNGDYINTDHNPVTNADVNISLPLTTYKFQDNNGRTLIEERYISIVADASALFLITPFVNGRVWATAFQTIIDPADYPTNTLKETEYQAYQVFRSIGNYLHYDIITTAPCTIYSIMLNTLMQRGSILPGFDPFEILNAVRVVPPFASVSGNIIESGTRVDTFTETGTTTDVIIEGV